LSAGTIIGSGTVSNVDASKGSSCIVERRMREKLEKNKIETPYLKAGDSVRIEVVGERGSIFGAIEQRVARAG
jgi:fumarylacetoacetate (FAA) hydrolase